MPPVASDSLIHRYYDPATGQFLSVDPLVDQTGQPYAYTGDNPVNAVDPLGLLFGIPNPFKAVWHGVTTGYNAVNTAVNWASGQVNAAVCRDLPGPNRGSLAGWLQDQAGCGSGNETSTSSNSSTSSTRPLTAGALRPGSTADQARAAAERDGFNIPENYIASPADNGKGWVFRPPGSTGDANAIRVAGADAQNPNGYVRIYNEKGIPVDAQGRPLGTKGVGQGETHLPLSPDETPPFEG